MSDLTALSTFEFHSADISGQMMKTSSTVAAGLGCNGATGNFDWQRYVELKSCKCSGGME